MRWPVFAAIVPELVPRSAAAGGAGAERHRDERVAHHRPAGGRRADRQRRQRLRVRAQRACCRVARGLRHPALAARARSASALPGERFVGAMRVGVQYVRQSPRMRAVLLRIALFFLQSTALLALLPLVARGLRGGDAGTFTLLLAAMGVGRDRRGAAACRACASAAARATSWCARHAAAGRGDGGRGAGAERLWSRCRRWWSPAWPGSRWPTR